MSNQKLSLIFAAFLAKANVKIRNLGFVASPQFLYCTILNA